MRIVTKLLVLTVLALSFLSIAPLQSAGAANILTPPTPGGNDKLDYCNTSDQTRDSAVCNDRTSKDNPLTGCPTDCGNGILYKITNIISYVAGAAAVIIMIVGALRLAMSGSDISNGARTDTDVEDARRAIAGSVIGLAIIIGARELILFVLSKI